MTSRNNSFDLLAEVRLGADCFAKHVARRNMRDPKMGRKSKTLCSFAGALAPKEHDALGFGLAHWRKKPS
jgi:hypothetical protein